MKEYISIGQIINSHGVKGELKIFPLTDDLKRFIGLKKVYIDGTLKNVTWAKLAPPKVILKIEGIESLEQALLYKNKYIEVNREDAVKLKEGNYFIADIIGCIVYDTLNNELGKVTEVLQTGSNDVYIVKGGSKDLLVPALKTVVQSIDVLEEKIIIKPEVEWSW